MKSKIAVGLLLILFSLTSYACSKDMQTTDATTDAANTTISSAIDTTSEETTLDITTQLITCGDGEKIENGTCVELSLMNMTFSLEEVTEDFDRAVYLLGYYNPMLFSVQEDIDEVIIRQRLLLRDEMTTLDLLRVIAPVVAAYKCGHTNIFPGTDLYMYITENALFFPLLVRLFDQKLYVINNIETTDIPIGSQILSINGKDVEELIILFSDRLSKDGENSSYIYNIINSHFNYFFFHLIDSEKTFILEYIEPESTEIKSKLINGITKGILEDNQENDEFLACEAIYEEDYAILKIRTFQPLDDFPLSAFDPFYLEFFTYVNNHQIENVIIDVRGNGGGDPRPSSDLFSYIAEYSQPYWDESAPNYYPGLKNDVPLKEPHFNGNLYVLIDGGCFSTTGHFSALVKSQDIAIFVGEETGGSYVCSDSASAYNLSNTGLTLYTSKQIWEVAAEGLVHGRGIMPDYEVYMTLEDYLNGTDTVLEYTLNLINNNQ